MHLARSNRLPEKLIKKGANPDISHFWLRLSLTPGLSPCHYPHHPREGLSLTEVPRCFQGHRQGGFQFPFAGLPEEFAVEARWGLAQDMMTMG
jgi:hypothetical protein